MAVTEKTDLFKSIFTANGREAAFLLSETEVTDMKKEKNVKAPRRTRAK